MWSMLRINVLADEYKAQEPRHRIKQLLKAFWRFSLLYGWFVSSPLSRRYQVSHKEHNSARPR